MSLIRTNADEQLKRQTLVVRLLIVGFHHKKGNQIEYSFPAIEEEKALDDRWLKICSLALPDGAHQRENDLIYFHSTSLENSSETIFGISSFRQIDANKIEKKDSDVTRNSIQKSVCLLLRKPLYDQISDQLQILTKKYFEEQNFSERKLFDDFVIQLNENLSEKINRNYFSIRQVFLQYRRKILILFKLILLQKKVLFLLTPIENLVKTLYALISLIPGVIDKGLFHSTLFDEENSFPIDLNQINEEEKKSFQDPIEETTMKLTLFKRATSLTNKLNESLQKLTSTASLSSSNETRTTTTNEIEFDWSSLDDSQFVYPLFGKNHLFHPYLSIYYLDLLKKKEVKSYLIGASNYLFRQDSSSSVQHDLIINDEQEDFLINSPELRQELQLTTADLRFLQLFQDQQSNVRSEEEIRHLFQIYFFSLLSVAQSQDEEGINDFNSSFIQSFRKTDAFCQWSSEKSFPQINQIIPKHPQAGQLNVNDVKLRVAHVLDDSQAGRKVKETLEGTSQFLGEKSRTASKYFGQAKTSLLNSFLTTFNQAKQ